MNGMQTRNERKIAGINDLDCLSNIFHILRSISENHVSGYAVIFRPNR